MSQTTAKLVEIMVAIRDQDRTECGRDLFELLGHPDSCFITETQLDELLFKVVRKCFGTSIYADMLLMAFGLLQGYEYKNLSIGKRREKFLRKSNWLKVNRKRKIKDYDSMSPEDQESAWKSLRNVEKYWMGKIADELLTQIEPKNKDGINKYIQSLDNYVEKVKDDAGKIIDYIPKERVTFLVTEDDVSGEEPIGLEETDEHDTFEEEKPEGGPSQPQPCPPPQPPSAPIPGAKEKGVKTPRHRVFTVVVSAFLIAVVALTIAYQGLRQQQHQKELELLRELFQAPSGSEIEITESNSLSIGDAEYKMETTVTIRTPEIPDAHSESIVEEEFTEPFSEPLD